MRRDDKHMSDLEERPQTILPGTRLRRIGIFAALFLVAFLLGLIPMWLKARERGNALAETEQRLALSTMQNDLASAVITSRRGDYEPARQAASQFFTNLRAEVDKGSTSIITQAQRDAIQPLFNGRDEIITLLARSDPASADKLSDLYVAYRKIMNS